MIQLGSLRATLESLRAEAEKQAIRFGNGAGAAGIHYAVEEMMRALDTERERLVNPDEAAAYSGLSKRQLRRIAANHGSPRSPLYRLSELPIKRPQASASERAASVSDPAASDPWQQGELSTTTGDPAGTALEVRTNPSEASGSNRSISKRAQIAARAHAKALGRPLARSAA